MPWAAGTATSTKLADEVKGFIESKIAAAPYKGRLPKSFYTVLKRKPAQRTGGVQVEVYVGRDDRPPHRVKVAGQDAVATYHAIVVDVKGEDKTGGQEAAEAMAEVIKSLFLTASHRADLVTRGVFYERALTETPMDGETEFQRPFSFVCSTDVYL